MRGAVRRGPQVRTNASDGNSNDGTADAGDADSASPSDSLFTPEFAAAFREAQTRLDEKQANSPERQRIDQEVAKILQRVETERNLEGLLPGEEAGDRVDGEDADEKNGSGKKNQIQDQFGDGLNNPLFSDKFKLAFIESQDRLEKKNAPMMAKISDEVAEIMKQVNEERAARERGEVVDTSKPLGKSSVEKQPQSDVVDALGSLFGEAPSPSFRESIQRPPGAQSPTSSYGQLPSTGLPGADPSVLAEMRISSQTQLKRLQQSLVDAEQAVLAEQMQLQRIDFAVKKLQRPARYAEADRVAMERRDAEDGR